MKKIFSLSVSTFLIIYADCGLYAQSSAKKDKYVINVVTDKQDAIYGAGDTIRFNVSLLEDGKPVTGKELDYVITADGQDAVAGKINSSEKPVIIETKLCDPGFVLCRVSINDGDKSVYKLGGAAVEPLKIKAADNPSEEFEKFWNEKIAMLQKLPFEVKMLPADIPENLKGKVECFDIRINCPGGAPVSGYFSRPVHAAEKSLPAIVTYHAAGVRSASKLLSFAEKGILALDINAHGIDNGKPDEFYEKLGQNELKGYYYFDCGDRKKSYFLGMFLRVYRSLQFVKSQSEWDGKTLISYGSSQGGAQALVAAGFDPQVTFCAAFVPGLCDHQGIRLKRQSGWPQFIRNGKTESEKENLSQVSKYFDVANFTKKIKARTIVTVGFIDTTCSPSSVYAAYNNINAPKEIINNPLCGHVNPAETWAAVAGKVDDYINSVKKQKNCP